MWLFAVDEQYGKSSIVVVSSMVSSMVSSVVSSMGSRWSEEGREPGPRLQHCEGPESCLMSRCKKTYVIVYKKLMSRCTKNL